MPPLICSYAYAKYAEARLGVRTLYADEILKDGFCVNMINTPLCPLNVVTHLQVRSQVSALVLCFCDHASLVEWLWHLPATATI